MTHQGAACKHQVGTGCIEALVDEEVLLLPTQVGNDFLHIGIEVVAYVGGCHVDGMECTEQWCLVVECLTGVGDEDCRNTECIVDDEYWRCRIPGRIATCLEGGADTA